MVSSSGARLEVSMGRSCQAIMSEVKDSGGLDATQSCLGRVVPCWTAEGTARRTGNKKIGRNTSVIMRRTIALALLSCIGFAAPAFAQATYPSRSITISGPHPPGGNLDVVTRLITPSMSQTLGQTIVVDNRPGAGGLIGHALTTRATADGYTILTTANGSLAYAPKLQPQPPFRAADFAAIGSIAVTPMVLEVNAAGRYKSVADFLAYAKEHPGQVTIGHSGN